MGLTAITHHNSPYTADQIHEMGQVGSANPRSRRGLGNKKAAALSMADRLIKKLNERQKNGTNPAG